MFKSTTEESIDEEGGCAPPDLFINKGVSVNACGFVMLLGWTVIILAVINGSIYLSYLGFHRSGLDETRGFCGNKYTLDGYVTAIVSIKDYGNYKVWMNIYKNGWPISGNGAWFYLDNQRMIQYNIFDYLNKNDSIPVYKSCSVYGGAGFYLERGHEYYNIPGYMALAILSVFVTIVCVIGLIFIGATTIIQGFMLLSVVRRGDKTSELFEEL